MSQVHNLWYQRRIIRFNSVLNVTGSQPLVSTAHHQVQLCFKCHRFTTFGINGASSGPQPMLATVITTHHQYTRIHLWNPRSIWNPSSPEKALLVTSVRLQVALAFRHVKGHAGIHGNEVADQLADRGAAGRVSPHFARWTQPPDGPMGGGAPPPRGPKAKPAPKVRLRRPAAAPGIENAELIPIADRPGYFLCESCNQGFRRGDLPQHRPDCRGPEPANRTCMFCNKILGSIQARRNHERYTHSQEALNAGLISQIPKRCR